MLEFVKDNKKVRLWYQFDSKHADEEELYAKYDFDDFHYDIDIDDAKETICWELSKVIEKGYTSSGILDALNELDSWECVDWFNIIKKCEDILIEEYKLDAMEHFVEKHQEITKDDIDDMEYDRRRCEE